MRKTITLFLFATLLVAGLFDVTGQTIQNNVFWKDTSGNPIYSQGGGVLKVGNTYYWYGAKYNGAITYYNNPYSGKNGDTGFISITCYSSTDLVNWKNEGDVLSAADIPGGISWLGRVGIAFNQNTRQYVLISQLNSGILFATNSSPTGRFTFRHTQETITSVVNDMSGDQSVFTDTDGQAYLIYCNRQGRSYQYVSRLRPSDYLYVEQPTNIYRASGGREGNVMFKQNGTYYFITSDLHGWNTSRTYVVTATNIMGPYSSEFVMQGTQNDYSHVTQSGLAVQVNGTSGSFVIFGGDRWANFAGNGVGYNQWVPITFNGTTPIFHSLSQWNINASAGTWSVGSGNNYVLNPNFEADRIDVTTVTGWTNSIVSGTTPNGNRQGSHFPGRFCLEQYSTGAYEASMFQNISLPNGTYTLKTWVKSSGGQSAARVYVKNYGGTEKNYSINQTINNWTEVSITNISVTNGSIQVGVYSKANAGNWVNVDDFSLVSTGGSSCNPTSITPYLQVNGGTWQEANSVTVNSGDQIKFGPQPATGGTWSWSGCGTSGSSREQTVSPTSSCTATATYTNSCGTVSSQTFTINVSGGTGGSYIQLRNRATGLFLDGMGRTANGDACGQNANTSLANAQWTMVDAGAGYYQLQNRGTGLYLDGMGRTTNGSDCGQYANTSHQNSHWALQQYSGSYYRIQNRGTGLFLDGLGFTANGSVVGQWANSTSQNAQWQIVTVTSGAGARVAFDAVLYPEISEQSKAIRFYPNPVAEELYITLDENDGQTEARIVDMTGKVVLRRKLVGPNNKIEVHNLQQGIYFVEVATSFGLNRSRLIKR